MYVCTYIYMYTYIYTHTPLKAPTYPFEGLYIALYRALFRGYFCLSFWSQSIGNTKSEKNIGKNVGILFWGGLLYIFLRIFEGPCRSLGRALHSLMKPYIDPQKAPTYPFEGPYIALYTVLFRGYSCFGIFCRKT